jgi:hypothetical protein
METQNSDTTKRGRGKMWLGLLIGLVIGAAAVAAGFYLWQRGENEYYGTVSDITGEPLEGAVVHAGNTTVTTDAAGKFTVKTREDVEEMTIEFGEEEVIVGLDEELYDPESYSGEDTPTDAGLTIDYSTVETLTSIFGNETTALEGMDPVDQELLEEEIQQSYYPHADDEEILDGWGVNITVPVITGELDMPPPVDPNSFIENDEGFEVVAGEIVIGWTAGTTESEREAVIAAADAEMLYDNVDAQMSIAKVSDHSEVVDAIAAIEASYQVTAAMENYRLEEDVAPNDPDYKDRNTSWWLRQLHAEPSWAMSPGRANTVVAVIDVGFQLNHPDLAGAFTEAKLNYSAGLMTDNPKHGTHVSGIVAARKNNSLGLAGIAPGVRIVPVRLDDFGRLPAVFTQLAGFNNVRIATMSMGWGWGKINKKRVREGKAAFTAAQMQAKSDAYDQIIRPSFVTYYTKGGVMCKSAGNDNGLDSRLNLLNYNEVITVGSADIGGGISSFSNTGPQVDILAPGRDIYSTLNGSTYGKLSGTSMATPAVCGTVAAIRSIRPNYGPLIIKRILERSGQTLASSTAALPNLDTWRSLLRATKLFGVEGDALDENLSAATDVLVTTEPSFWSVLPDSVGRFYLPYLKRQSWKVKAKKDKAKDEETVSAPALGTDDPVVSIFLALEKDDEEEDTNANTNANDNSNENTNEDENENENTNSESNENENTNTSGNTNSGDTGDNTDSVDDDGSATGGTTTTKDGIVISAEGCAVLGFKKPKEDANGQCPAGFTFSRDTIACEQTECPASSIGRTYTLECKCADTQVGVYACGVPGYLVACVDAQ